MQQPSPLHAIISKKTSRTPQEGELPPQSTVLRKLGWNVIPNSNIFGRMPTKVREAIDANKGR
jgi:hypothetical protein